MFIPQKVIEYTDSEWKVWQQISELWREVVTPEELADFLRSLCPEREEFINKLIK